MRRTHLLGMLFALIAGIATAVAFLSQPYSAYSSPPIVSVSEPEIADPPLDVGKTFTVDINIKKVTNLYTWQAGITFNASVLEAITFSEGPFLKQGGSTLWVNGTIDNTNGIIVYHAASLAGNVTGVSDKGTLGTITFEIKQYGNSTIHLTNIILLDPMLSEYIEKKIDDYTVRIKIPGDINGDDTVDIFDLALLGRAYGSTPGAPNWNAEADLNQDNIVNVVDLAFLGENHGKTV